MNAFMSTAAMIATAIIPPHIHALATFPATFIMIAMIDAAFAFQRVLKQGKTPTV